MQPSAFRFRYRAYRVSTIVGDTILVPYHFLNYVTAILFKIV